MEERPRAAGPGSRHSHDECRATCRGASCPTPWSFKAIASDQQHICKDQSGRGTQGLPPSLPTWTPAFWFPAWPASKLQAPQAHFQSQEEQQTAVLRPDTGEPSSDSHSIPEAVAHSRLCRSPLQCLLSHQARPGTLQSQFRQ